MSEINLLRKDWIPTTKQNLLLRADGINSAIVDREADIEVSIESLLQSFLPGAGQLGSSISRIFIHQSLFSPLVEPLIEALRNIDLQRTDQPSFCQEKSFLGPLRSEQVLRDFFQFQTMANREAKETLLWSRPQDEQQQGCFITPAVHYFDHFDPKSTYQTNHCYGPKILLYQYQDVDKAISASQVGEIGRFINFYGKSSTIHQRASSVFSSNLVCNDATISFDTRDYHSRVESVSPPGSTLSNLVSVLMRQLVCAGK